MNLQARQDRRINSGRARKLFPSGLWYPACASLHRTPCCKIHFRRCRLPQISHAVFKGAALSIFLFLMPPLQFSALFLVPHSHSYTGKLLYSAHRTPMTLCMLSASIILNISTLVNAKITRCLRGHPQENATKRPIAMELIQLTECGVLQILSNTRILHRGATDQR